MSPRLDPAILRAIPVRAEIPDAASPGGRLDSPVAQVAGPSPVVALSQTGAVIDGGPRDVRDALADMLDDTAPATETIRRARCDDLARRVLREGGNITITALAREVGSCTATVRRVMATRLYRDVYNRVSDEIHGTIDDRIADERLDVLARGDTLQRRALTVLGECLELSRQHAANVRNGAAARPGLLKVAVDAAAEIRQVVTARGARSGDGATTVNVNITRNQATIIQGAIRESGVDLSDVLNGAFVIDKGGA